MYAMRRTWIALAVLGLVSWGCGPIGLHVQPEPAVTAALSVRMIEGTRAAVPAECQAPCTIMISHGTTQELNLRAPGYYPATMEVSYDQLRTARAVYDPDGSKLLVVPLQRRPTESLPAH